MKYTEALDTLQGELGKAQALVLLTTKTQDIHTLQDYLSPPPPPPPPPTSIGIS